jgi:hypothetical protein
LPHINQVLNRQRLRKPDSRAPYCQCHVGQNGWWIEAQNTALCSGFYSSTNPQAATARRQLDSMLTSASAASHSRFSPSRRYWSLACTTTPPPSQHKSKQCVATCALHHAAGAQLCKPLSSHRVLHVKDPIAGTWGS